MAGHWTVRPWQQQPSVHQADTSQPCHSVTPDSIPTVLSSPGQLRWRDQWVCCSPRTLQSRFKLEHFIISRARTWRLREYFSVCCQLIKSVYEWLTDYKWRVEGVAARCLLNISQRGPPRVWWGSRPTTARRPSWRGTTRPRGDLRWSSEPVPGRGTWRPGSGWRWLCWCTSTSSTTWTDWPSQVTQSTVRCLQCCRAGHGCCKCCMTLRLWADICAGMDSSPGAGHCSHHFHN